MLKSKSSSFAGKTCMKLNVLKGVIGVLTMLMLGACGARGENDYPILLKLEMPQSLARTEQRREKFMQMADFLKVTVETKEGVHFEQLYSKLHWEKITMPPFHFPKTESDTARFKVEILAKNLQGLSKGEAVLRGEGTLSAQKMRRKDPNDVVIKLSLLVRPETWD